MQHQIPVLLLLDQEAAGRSGAVAGGEPLPPPAETPLDEAGLSSAGTVSDHDAPPSASEGAEPQHGECEPTADRVDKWLPAADTATDAADEETRTDDPEWSAPFADTLPPCAAESAEDPPDELKDGDTSPPGAGEPGGSSNGSAETVEELAGHDIKADKAASGPARRTWDDAEQMERLLASVESRPAPNEAAHGRESSEPTDASAAANEAFPQIAPHRDGPRRKRSPARLIAGIALGGLGGSAVACYILLWARGPEGDVLDVARFLPSAILPASFQQAPAQLADDRSPPADDSAEVAAAYEAPVAGERSRDSFATGEPGGDVLGSSGERISIPSTPHDAAELEPLDFDEPDAAPLAGEAAVVRDAPSYSADALAAALEAARDAQQGLIHGSLSEEALQRTKAISYVTLCQLAEVLTFADRQSQPHEGQSLRREADQLFRETLAQPRTRSEVAIITTKWLDSPSRRQNGVFLAGTVIDQTVNGGIVEYHLDTEIGTTLTVLVPIASADVAPPNAPVAVIGAIIDQPSERIDGYTGSAWRAIWTERLIPLDDVSGRVSE